MNIFAPYPDLQKSVSCLDPKRLGNQVYREGLTLIRGGWPNHPCSKIWAAHKHSLAKYCLFGLEELKRRGRNYPKWFDYFNNCLKEFPDTGLPPIFGNEKFHSSHRAALLHKNYDYYSNFNWSETPKIDYVWKI